MRKVLLLDIRVSFGRLLSQGDSLLIRSHCCSDGGFSRFVAYDVANIKKTRRFFVLSQLSEIYCKICQGLKPQLFY